MEAALILGVYGIALIIVTLTLHTRHVVLIPLAYIWSADFGIVLFAVQEFLVDADRDITHILLALAFTVFAVYVTIRRKSGSFGPP
ncbi:hypothetical protein [Allopusillimonas ginsengisoli]|uniref:hypothetical protein n=1 Tax=Allopusillimonas ginsengisoli TaxID=453575 RepID=UPI00101FDB7A|nr:hypothetical protein [Allopusillimonas ginsengisoli]TEA77306.1 hypothetical protein ERE07_15260 [Allopusillimonas ginsengisoli]